MENKNVLYVVLVVSVIIAGIIWWGQKYPDGMISSDQPAATAISLENPPEVPSYLIGGLGPEREKSMKEFRAKILAKVSSGQSFTSKEKQVVSDILKTKNISYRFTQDEIAKIEVVLAK